MGLAAIYTTRAAGRGAGRAVVRLGVRVRDPEASAYLVLRTRSTTHSTEPAHVTGASCREGL